MLSVWTSAVILYRFCLDNLLQCSLLTGLLTIDKHVIHEKFYIQENTEYVYSHIDVCDIIM